MSGVTVQFSYTYNTSTQGLKRAKPYGKVISADYQRYTNSSYDALNLSKTLYTSYSCKTKIKTVSRGTLAAPTYIYMSGDLIRIKLKFTDGSTGWVKGHNGSFDTTKLLFENCFYAG